MGRAAPVRPGRRPGSPYIAYKEWVQKRLVWETRDLKARPKAALDELF